MLSDQRSESKVIVGVLAAFTVIGLLGAGQMADAGVVVTWLWMGIGLSVTYLLYRLLVVLERIAETA